MSRDILLRLLYTSAISHLNMAPKNSPSPDPASSTSTPTNSVDEINRRTLRDVINNSPLEPSPRPSICNGTPADFIPYITMAHTCGLTSGISCTPTLPAMIKLPNTMAAQEYQWAYIPKDFSMAFNNDFEGPSPSPALFLMLLLIN